MNQVCREKGLVEGVRVRTWYGFAVRRHEAAFVLFSSCIAEVVGVEI